MTEAILISEPAIRLGLFLGVFAVIALWGVPMPRRQRAVSRWARWPSSLGIVALNTALLRILMPTAAIGLALLSADRGWGLLNQLGMPVWMAVVLAVVVLDLAIYLQHVLL